MKSYIEHHNKTNQRILLEIEDIKTKKQVEDYSPNMPKTLDFDTLGSISEDIPGSSTSPLSIVFQQVWMGAYQSFLKDPSLMYYPQSRIPQDPPSARIKEPKVTEVHDENFIPMQTIAFTGPAITS